MLVIEFRDLLAGGREPEPPIAEAIIEEFLEPRLMHDDLPGLETVAHGGIGV